MKRKVWKIKYFVAGEWMWHEYKESSPVTGPEALRAWWDWIKSEPEIECNNGTMIMQTADIVAAEVHP